MIKSPKNGLKPRGAMDSMDLDAAHGTGHGHHDEAAVQKAITHLWCQKKLINTSRFPNMTFQKKLSKCQLPNPPNQHVTDFRIQYPFYFRSFTRKTVVVEFLNLLSNPIPKEFYHPAMEFGLWLPNKLLCIFLRISEEKFLSREIPRPQ